MVFIFAIQYAILFLINYFHRRITMKKQITKIAALLLVGALLIQPQYPNSDPKTNDGAITTLNYGDDEPIPQKK